MGMETLNPLASSSHLFTARRLCQHGWRRQEILLPFIGLGINLEHLLGEAAHGSRELSYGRHVLCTVSGHMWNCSYS